MRTYLNEHPRIKNGSALVAVAGVVALAFVTGTEYGSSDEEVYLVGNLLAGGKELDALLVKEDALIVIDFKDYGGTLVISENEPWTISGIEINSNRKKPFRTTLR